MRVGAMELRLSRWIAERGPMTVRQAAETFGKEHEVVITTVQQMMERLRKKGVLEREQVDGVWTYRSVETQDGMLRGVVQDFVERTLGGSLEPFALYLSANPDISDAEVDRLKQIVERLSEERERDR